MIINVDDLLDKDLHLTYEETQDVFESLADPVSTGDIAFIQPIRFDLRAYRVGELIVADGRYNAPVSLKCARCLTEFEFILTSDFRLTYSGDAAGPDAKTDARDVELGADEIGMLSFNGQHIDLRPALQEELVLALPMQPLCKDSCKGLCSKCGANLNTGECGCAKQQINPKFAALKNLKLNS